MEASAVPRLAPAGVSLLRSPHLLRLAPDSHLVALIREGRRGAFEAVYDRHHRGILSFCRHMLGDPEEAEDAVQHTFLAAYNGLISSHKQIHLRAWLFAIARNRCYSMMRARREQPAAEIGEAITEGLATQVQRRQELRDLVLDMQRLPEDQRAALVLAELESLSHEEIGQALGVPREKVKALVFQARESLVASRTARETDCAEIREQLATQRAGALRRANLRRHLRECPGCRDFKRHVERQRRQLAILLPVVPTIALKQGVLTATVSGGATVGIAGGGVVFSSALHSGLAKVVVGAVVAGMGTAGTIVATSDLKLPFGTSVSHGHRAPGGISGATNEGTATTRGPTESVASQPGHPDLPALSTSERATPDNVTKNVTARTQGLPTGGVSFVPPGAAGFTAVIRSTGMAPNKLSVVPGRPTGALPIMIAPPSRTAAWPPTTIPSPGTTTQGNPSSPASMPPDVLGQGTGIIVGRGSWAGHHGGPDGGYGSGPTGKSSPGGSTRGEGRGNGGSGNGVGGSGGGGESSGSGSGTYGGPGGGGGSGAAGSQGGSAGSDGSGGQGSSGVPGSSGTSSSAPVPPGASSSPTGGDGSTGSSGSAGSSGSNGAGASGSSGGASISPHGNADAPGGQTTTTPPAPSSGSSSGGASSP